jgi:hypothetical protein
MCLLRQVNYAEVAYFNGVKVHLDVSPLIELLHGHFDINVFGAKYRVKHGANSIDVELINENKVMGNTSCHGRFIKYLSRLSHSMERKLTRILCIR